MSAVLEFGQTILDPVVLLFTISSLASMGLQVVIPRAIQKVRNPRLPILTLVWGWLAGPAIGYLITTVLPLAKPYAVVLLIGSMAPSAPFLPVMVERARADSDFAGAFIMVATVCTVVIAPLMAPLLIPGLTLSTAALVTPLVLTVLIPLLIGAAIRTYAPGMGTALYGPVKAIAGVSTIVMMLDCFLLYGQQMLNTAGSLAFASLTLFMVILGVVAYRFGFGLRQSERSVMSLGMGSRSFAVILTVVLTMPDVDPQMPAMVIMWTVVSYILSAVAASMFHKQAELPVAGRA